MTDIVERLRWCAVHGDQEQAIAAMEKAADEIERLQITIERSTKQSIAQYAEIERLRAHNKVLCDNQHDHVRYCTRIHEQDAEIERLQAALGGGKDTA